MKSHNEGEIVLSALVLDYNPLNSSLEGLLGTTKVWILKLGHLAPKVESFVYLLEKIRIS